MEELDRMRGAYRQKRKTVPRSLQPRPAAKEEQGNLERPPWRDSHVTSQGLRGLTIPQRGGTLPALQAPSPARDEVSPTLVPRLPPLVPRPPSSRHLEDIARHFANDRGAEGLAREGLRYANDRTLMSPHEQTASHVTEPSRAEFSKVENGFGRKYDRETSRKIFGKRVRGQETKPRYEIRQDQAILGAPRRVNWGVTPNQPPKRSRKSSGSVPESAGLTIPQRGRLKRDYAEFNTNKAPRLRRGVRYDMSYDHEPEPDQRGQMFMSPEMQNSNLPSVSTGEKQAQQAQQAQQANQQAQNQDQVQLSPALKSSTPEQAITAHDQALQRGMDIPRGAGQESTSSHSTGSDAVPNFKFDPILAPPGMPPQFYPQTLRSPAPPAPPEQAVRTSKRHRATPAHAFSESARMRSIDELDDRSPVTRNDQTAYSGYSFSRRELKHTISEDCTTDAFKRRKNLFIALEQPLSRAARIEPLPSRGAEMTAREQRSDWPQNIEVPRTIFNEFVPQATVFGSSGTSTSMPKV